MLMVGHLYKEMAATAIQSGKRKERKKWEIARSENKAGKLN